MRTRIKSMTTLMTHTFAHFTGPSFVLKTKRYYQTKVKPERIEYFQQGRKRSLKVQDNDGGRSNRQVPRGEFT